MHFFAWIGSSILWWVHHCVKCKALNYFHKKLILFSISLLAPKGPGDILRVAVFAPVCLTITDLFCRLADVYATTEPNIAATGSSNALVHASRLFGATRFGPSLTTNCGPAKGFRANHEHLGTNKITTSSYHPSTHDGLERISHTIA